MFTLGEILEMLSPLNFYYASEKLGRQATIEDAIFHWLFYRPRPLPPHLHTFEVTDDKQLTLFT